MQLTAFGYGMEFRFFATTILMRNMARNPAHWISRSGVHLSIGCPRTEGTSSERGLIRDTSDIPGPRRVPFIGTAWTLFPLVGCDDFKKLHRSYYEKYLKYGKIVRENFMGKTVVSVYDPADIEIVFRKEGRYPIRTSHEILLKIRKEHPELFATRGLIPTNEEEWSVIRENFQQEINRVEIVTRYLPNLDAASKEFIDYLARSRNDDGIIPDLVFKMHEWALENVCINVLDTRLDGFTQNRNPLCRQLIEGANEALIALVESEYFPIWKLVETKGYKLLTEIDLLFYKVAKHYVEQKLEDIQKCKTPDFINKDSVEMSVLEKYLRNPKHDLRDVITLASDLLFTGLLTTAVTVSFVIYHLSRNLDKQDVLFEELKRLLPNQKTCITAAHIEKMSYLKACIKESMRLNPVAFGTSRSLPVDVILAGYKVPSGTAIITQNQIAGNLPEYVDYPGKFLPERWLRGSPTGLKRPHPYLVLPFGAGPRSCLARRFAELEMNVFIALLIRKFQLEWMGTKDVDVVTRLLNIPDGPMDIKAVIRQEQL